MSYLCHCIQKIPSSASVLAGSIPLATVAMEDSADPLRPHQWKSRSRWVWVDLVECQNAHNLRRSLKPIRPWNFEAPKWWRFLEIFFTKRHGVFFVTAIVRGWKRCSLGDARPVRLEKSNHAHWFEFQWYELMINVINLANLTAMSRRERWAKWQCEVSWHEIALKGAPAEIPLPWLLPQRSPVDGSLLTIPVAPVRPHKRPLAATVGCWSYRWAKFIERYWQVLQKKQKALKALQSFKINWITRISCFETLPDKW